MASSSPSSGAITLETLNIIMHRLEGVSDDIAAPAFAMIKLVRRVIATLDDVCGDREDCDVLQRRLLELLVVVMMAIQKQRTTPSNKATIPSHLKRNVDRLLENLITIDKEVTKINGIITSSKTRTATLLKCQDDLDWAMRAFDVWVQAHEATRLWEISRKVEVVLTNQYLENFPRAKHASFDCERTDKPSTCFEGTRSAILSVITDWITDPDLTTPRFFWLHGIAGIGKTTVACTIARVMQNLGLLGGQFCFSRRGEAELRNPALVFPTLAHQLALFDSEFLQRITLALEADREAPYASLKQQLDRLIITPLSGVERDPERVVLFVFDALDECEALGTKEILQLLVSAIPRLPFLLKVFITSRREPHIQSVLVPETRARITAFYDMESSVVRNDILLDFRGRCRKLAEKLDRDLRPDWPNESQIELLVGAAGSIFLYTATCLRFLSQSGDIREQFDVLCAIVSSLHRNSPEHTLPFAYLDQFYTRIIQISIPLDETPDVSSLLRLVLGSIILLRDSLPVDALERLTSLAPGQALQMIRRLHSVLFIPPPPYDYPRVYHPSFSDFLQDRTRCTDDRLWINTKEYEGMMAVKYLNVMGVKLRHGMIGGLDPTLLNWDVESLTSKIDETLTQELQYACRNWAFHLAKTPPRSIGVHSALDAFVSQAILLWIEVMSWLGDTVLALRCLESTIVWQAKSHMYLRTAGLLNDCYRLLLAHMPTVSRSAQHIAQSVIPFSPRNVSLTTAYSWYANCNVRVVRGVESKWRACLMVWKGHSDSITSVAISSDGSRLASASDDSTVRLQDMTTGNLIAKFEGHSRGVNSVVFSPDRRFIATGSDDKTVKVWDSITGTCTSTLKGHSDYISTLAFSPDGSSLASGAYDKAVRIWDTSTWNCSATLGGHSRAITSLSFSPDGSRIATGSHDATVRLWDGPTRTCMKTLLGHANYVTSIAFSPDASRLASGSTDKTVRVWDAFTGTCTATLEGHSSFLTSVTFSPDGLLLASGSHDKTVRLWDGTTGDVVATFFGHSSSVTSVTFHPGLSRLASGSTDATVRLWDTTTRHVEEPTEHSSPVTCIAFSPDGSRVATGSTSMIRLWDTATGDCTATWSDLSEVSCVGYSLDGLCLAVGSQGPTIRIWNTTTETCTTILKGLPHPPTSLIFSPDSLHIRVTDKYNSVYFWNVATGRQVEELDEDGFEDHTPTGRIKLNGRELIRTEGNKANSIVCFLPPGTDVSQMASIRRSGGDHDHVVVGCKNGQVIMLEISLE